MECLHFLSCAYLQVCEVANHTILIICSIYIPDFNWGFYWKVGDLELWSKFFEMKLSVAPKLTRTSLSAIACADSNKTGIHMDQYLLLYMLIRNALAQAARFRH